MTFYQKCIEGGHIDLTPYKTPSGSVAKEYRMIRHPFATLPEGLLRYLP